MSRPTVAVAGASGLIGAAVTEAFVEMGWHVYALSRRRPEVMESEHITHVPVDLMDSTSMAVAMSDLPEVTHVVYTAVFERADLVSGWTDSEQMLTNLSMLANVVGGLEQHGRLEHVTLMQGTKAYGVHLHAIPVPARERHPRDEHANFYWLQEDYLREFAARTGVAWTILRPVHVVGPAFGVAYSTPPVIGSFAAICRNTERPFGFPGGSHQTPKQVVDVRLVARATTWAALDERAWGEHFNVTNGEVFTWRDIWPFLADCLDVPCQEIEPLSMADFLPAHWQDWADVTLKHRLRPHTIEEIVGKSHMYADYTFGYGQPGIPPPALVSTVKIKQAGFTETMDTEQTFRDAITALRKRNVLPTYGPQ
jgi:nucleoside-diphosphate-sugar epimerase